MFEISAKKGLCYVICDSGVKTSDLAAHFRTILALQIRFCLLFKRSTSIQGWQNEVNRIYEATCDETSQVYKSNWD